MSTSYKNNVEVRHKKDKLARAWSRPAGLIGWLSGPLIRHRYAVHPYRFVFLLAGGVEALMMRFQLARADNTFLDAAAITDFTMHGQP